MRRTTLAQSTAERPVGARQPAMANAPFAPPPLSEEERAADQRALKWIVGWLGGCAFLGGLYLVFAIWLDWI